MSDQKKLNNQKIIIGSANFGLNYSRLNSYKKVRIKEIKKIFQYCKKNKISYLDTASGYGNAEKIIGNLDISKWKIITKVPKIKSQNTIEIESFLLKTIKNSLKNLKIKSVYAVLLHDETQLLSTNGKKIFKYLNYLKKKKLIKKIGISFYSPRILLRTVNHFKIDLIQIPLNYINKNFLNKKIISYIKKEKVEVHARSIFLQGLLLKKKNYDKRFKKFITYLNIWHKHNKISRLESSLNFIYQFDFIDKYIFGLENVNQLKQIIKTKKHRIINFPKFKEKYIKDPRKWT